MPKSDYDIGAAFAAIEEELIASMMRNMERHGKQEAAEGFQWAMWQAKQLKELNKYKKANQKKFRRPFQEINGSIRRVIEQARKQGNMEQESEILEAIKKGWKAPRKTDGSVRSSAEFFKWNTRKLEALIKATEHDFQKAEIAMLRMANDQYRRIIFNAQVYANTGAGTYEKAVDMAARDFLAAGINCVEYKNGARHTTRDYADMAIQTASKRAYLTGAGEKRQEWGISTVIMNKRGNPCPKCLPFVGRIMIDDVWSGGKASDGPYPLMSSAISAGLYHPRCKDSHTTYFPGVSSEPKKATQEDKAAVKTLHAKEQQRNHSENMVKKMRRLEKHSLAPDNKKQYAFKAERLEQKHETTHKPAKKEYLTAKKLQQKIDEATAEIENLKMRMPESGDMEAMTGRMNNLQAEINVWQAKLDEKLVKKEIKKLQKEQEHLQQEIDDFEIKTYSGIWKDDVTTKQWLEKSGSIQDKLDYFNNKLSFGGGDEQQKFIELKDQLEEFNQLGSEYFAKVSKRDKLKKDLDALKKDGKLPGADQSGAFSQNRKDNAKWFDKAAGGFAAADRYFDPPAKLVHAKATSREKKGFYAYTQASGGHNRPLAGFEKPYYEPGTGWEEKYHKGEKKVWIDFEGKGDEIRGLTTLIEKSTYDSDIWLQSGQNHSTIEGFLGLPRGSLSNMSDTELQAFVGTKNKIYNFVSTAVNEGGGSMFNSKPLKINFYAPKGSQMLYASNAGAFGKSENEMILQRGGTYEIIKMYWGKDATDGGKRKIFVDMEIHPEEGYDLFQQDPSEWKGEKKNYHDK